MILAKLLAAGDVMSVDWVAAVIQVATAGGFGALVWYLIVKHIPAIQAAHKEERDEWRAYIDKRDDAFGVLVERFRTAIETTHGQLNTLTHSIADLKGTIREHLNR